MSCGACNCDDCRIDRLEIEETPSSEVWLAEVNKVFNQYGGCTINMSAMVSMVLRNMGVDFIEYRRWEKSLVKFLRDELPTNGFSVIKGAAGGIRKTPPSNYAAQDAQGTISAWQRIVINPAVAGENYTCGCGNKKLSTFTDKSCWSCGAKVVGSTA